MDFSNPMYDYVSSNKLTSKEGEAVMELTNPMYVSTSEVTTKVPASSLTFSKPNMLQSKYCTRAIVVVACIVVVLAIASLFAAMTLAFANIRDVRYADNATQARIKQLVEDMTTMNRTIFELTEIIRNRTEDSRGPPGM